MAVLLFGCAVTINQASVSQPMVRFLALDIRRVTRQLLIGND